MGAAAAQVTRQRLADLGLARKLVLLEQGGRRHDHAVDAVAALRSLLVDERTLQLRGLRARTQALERGDRALELADRKQARARRLTLQVHGAGTALAQAAAEARAFQRE